MKWNITIQQNILQDIKYVSWMGNESEVMATSKQILYYIKKSWILICNVSLQCIWLTQDVFSSGKNGLLEREKILKLVKQCPETATKFLE